MKFLKVKDTIRKKTTLPPSPIRDRELNTIYSINKIVGADMWYNKFINEDLIEENKKALLNDFDDDTKYELVDVAFRIRTVYVDKGEIKETFKYNSEEEADADLKPKSMPFEFNVKSNGAVIKLTKTEIVKEVKK